jgi:hypothetical protein
LGKGALCGKIDIKSAFRLLIVSPSDFDLVGIYFDGKFSPVVLFSANGTPIFIANVIKPSISN